jgi:hypothetical protein
LLPAFLSHFSTHFHSLTKPSQSPFTLSHEKANSLKPLDFHHFPSIRADGPGAARKVPKT